MTNRNLFRRAWEACRLQAVPLLTVMLILAMLDHVPDYLSSLLEPHKSLGFILLRMAVLLAGFGLIALVELAGHTTAIHVLNHETVSIERALSCWRNTLRSLKLTILVALKLLLWLMPGIIAIALGFSLAEVTGTMHLRYLWAAPGFVLTWGLILPASLRYDLAYCVLAAQPDTPAGECIRRSKALMKGRMKQYFLLLLPLSLMHGGIPFLTKYLLLQLGVSYTATELVVFLISLILFTLVNPMALVVRTAFFQQLPAEERQREEEKLVPGSSFTSNKDLRRAAIDIFRLHPWKMMGRLLLMMALSLGAGALIAGIGYALTAGQGLIEFYQLRDGTWTIGMIGTFREMIPIVSGLAGGVMLAIILLYGVFAGFLYSLLQEVRFKAAGVRVLFSRMDSCVKMLGISCLQILFAAGWMLLSGFSIGLITGVLQVVLGNPNHPLFQVLLTLMSYGCSVLVYRSVIRNSFAPFFLADDLSLGVMKCLRLSRMITKGKAWRLFCLALPFAGIMIIAQTAINFGAGLLPMPYGALTAALLTCLVMIPLACLMLLAEALFYEETKPTAVRKADAEEEAPENTETPPEEETPAEEEAPPEENREQTEE